MISPLRKVIDVIVSFFTSCLAADAAKLLIRRLSNYSSQFRQLVRSEVQEAGDGRDVLKRCGVNSEVSFISVPDRVGSIR